MRGMALSVSPWNRIFMLAASLSIAFASGSRAFQEADLSETGDPWSSLAARGQFAEAMLSDVLPGNMPPDFAEIYLADRDSQLLNFTGRYDEAHRTIAPELFDPDYVSPDSDAVWIDTTTLENYSPVDAFEFIRNAAVGRNIVILNESHQMGQHRAFMARLLPILHEEGFTHFGMEALAESAEQAWENNGTATMESGFYFGDPLMASVLETADELGFQWFAYEVRSDQRLDCAQQACSQQDRIQNRETAQAQNIYDRVFADNPDARVVLYVGLSHLDETPGVSESGYRNGWMAAALADLTGFDPLTIDQVSGSGIGPSQIIQTVRDVHGIFDIQSPAVLVDENGHALQPPPSRWTADMALFLPLPSDFISGNRPAWLGENPERVSVAIDLPPDYTAPIVVQAFSLPRAERGLAIDQYSVLEGERFDEVTLMLPPGRYVIEGQMTSGTIVLMEELDVGGITPE